MSEFEIEQFQDSDAVAARPVILTAIDAYNDRATGLDEPARQLAIVIRDQELGQITGGLYGTSYYRWLFVELLLIPERHRGQGLGTRLIGDAEAVARARGCIGVWLDTFSFQARPFYEKLGYVVFGEIESYPPGHSRFWLRKRLD